MTALLTDNLPLLAGAPNGIKKLRELILELAVRGKLVPQDPSDEPASELLKRIAEEKARLLVEGKIKKQKPLADISEDEKPFELPVGWQWVRLGEIAEIIRGVTYGKSDASDSPLPGYAPLLRGNNINRVLNFDRPVFVPQKLISDHQYIQTGDIVIAMSSGSADLVGKAAQAETNFDGAFGAFCGVVRSRTSALFLFFGFFFQTPLYRVRAAGHGKGIGINNLQKSVLETLEVPLPPLAEQHRIVTKVDELMALCDRLEAQQADAESAHAQLVQALLNSLTQASDATDFSTNWQRLAEHFHTLFTTEPSIDALKQTLLQLAVMGKLVPQDPRDEPVESLLQRRGIKSKPHALQGWGAAPLGQLGEILGGSTPSKANAEFWNGDIPWVSPKDMKRPVIHDSEDHISAKALAETSLKAVPAKSLLMVVRGMILVHSFPVALTAREVTINQDMKALVPPEEISAYLHMYLQATKAVMVGLVDRSSHGTCKLISEKLWSHIVCLPPLPEQHRIVAKVDQLLGLCDQLKTRLTQARQLNEQLASTLVEQAVA